MTTTLMPSRSSALGARLLIGVALLLAAALWLHGPIAQWNDYHAFADTRPWLGIPNAADVLSNLPFALIGAWALVAFLRPGPPNAARPAWIALGLALIATAAGSAWYHWAPSDGPLVADRIPIAWACTAIVAALMAERGYRRFVTPSALVAGALVAAIAVGYWHASSDLRLYLFVQALPLLLAPTLLLARVRPVEPGAVPDAAWWQVLGCYLAAKAMEGLDGPVLAALGVVSGHTLKHLLAALGAALLLRAAIRTRAQLR
jgi:hypothetical protein